MQELKSFAPWRHSARAAGADRRVLFLPKNSRKVYFQSLLAAARQNLEWDVEIVCPAIARRLWIDVVTGEDKFHLIPNFNGSAPWEDDPASIAAIDALIAECEAKSDISAGRVVLSGERDLGRGYSKSTYYWFHNETARRALADNTEPFRILRRMFAFARDTLDRSRPDIVLAGEWADPLWFTFYLVAQQRGITCVVNRYSKLWSGRCFWSIKPTMYNDFRRNLTTAKREQSARVSGHARHRITLFRKQPTMIEYVRANWNRIDPSNWVRRHVDIVRAIGFEARHRLSGQDGPPPKPGLQLLFNHYLRPWLEWRNGKFFRRLEEKDLACLRYLYVALHKDPEQTLNYQAPYWANQLYTVGLLSSCLPYGFRLLVREHRANVGRRPSRFYSNMSELPAVVLIDAYDDQFKYIRNADLIVTDNGSAGWEGLLLGRRVITLADTYYDGTGLEHRVHEPEQLAPTVVEMLGQPPVNDVESHDRALGWLLDAEWETSAPIESSDHAESLALLAELLKQSVRHAAEAPLEPA
jgi:hypothetical protein